MQDNICDDIDLNKDAWSTQFFFCDATFFAFLTAMRCLRTASFLASPSFERIE